MSKRALVFTYQKNFRSISDWETFRMWQRSQDAATFLRKDVELIPWISLDNINSCLGRFDTLVLIENELGPKFHSHHKKYLLNFLRAFSGKRICLARDPFAMHVADEEVKEILGGFYDDDRSEEFKKWQLEKPNIAIGDELALNFWTPDTGVFLTPDFNFFTNLTYETATFCFSKYNYLSKVQMWNMVRSLSLRIKAFPAKEKTFIMPVHESLYFEDLEKLFRERLSGIAEIKKTNFPRTTDVWRYSVWDYGKNKLREGDYYVEID